MLSLLLRARDEDGEPMSDVELRDELMTMLAAGHETTATGLAWAFDLLLHNPAVARRGCATSSSGDDDAYLDAVVTETLRLRPVIDAAERTLKAPRTIAGWELPAGIRVYPGIALVHRREDLYPNAAAFRPERFLDGGAKSYTWLPFGGGIRRCIGAALAQAEMAEVLRVILKRVELAPVSPRTDQVVLQRDHPGPTRRRSRPGAVAGDRGPIPPARPRPRSPSSSFQARAGARPPAAWSPPPTSRFARRSGDRPSTRPRSGRRSPSASSGAV